MHNDIIDLRDLFDRFEELEADEARDEDDEGEFARLGMLLDELAGNGGDEQWRGDWYPLTLIHDSYFATYARELVEDIGDVPDGFPHYIVIDWEATAENIRQDYSSIEGFDGETYWYR